MYSSRLLVSSTTRSQIRRRIVQRSNSVLLSWRVNSGNGYHYNQRFQQQIPSMSASRYFATTDKSDSDKKSVEKKSGEVLPKKSSKTDYKKMFMDMARNGAYSTYSFFRHPTLIPMKLRYTWSVIKEEAHHYYLGFKLLSADIRTAKDIIFRILEGHSMTRRERLQLMRTVTDLARLVPFSLFILIPFMELLLPVAIKMFPNMLPSTFEDSLKREENLKNELNMRLSMASFFIDTIKTMAEQKKKKTKEKDEASDDNATASELIEFMDKSRMGEPLSHETVVRIARLFKDELTLANMPRPQLVTMCQFMNLQPFGSDAFLRFQLRSKLTSIKEDDKRILWEGVESLTSKELQDACRERGMRATGLNTFGYRKQLKEWLDLSMSKNTPISLLIMSRAFVLNLSKENRQLRYEESLQTSISSMDEDVVNEVIVQSASAKESESAEMKKRKLESLQFQNEMIQEELELKKEYKRKEVKSKEETPQEEEKKEELHLDTPKVIGIGDEHQKVESYVNPVAAPVRSTSTDLPFDKKFIKMMEGSKFDNYINEEIDETALSTEEIALVKHKRGAPLTAAEIQALGDMALQSAVEREKDVLAKLKSQIKELKLEKKRRKKEEREKEGQLEDSLARGTDGKGAEVTVTAEEVLSAFEKELWVEKEREGLEAQRSREVSQKVFEKDLVYKEKELTPSDDEILELESEKKRRALELSGVVDDELKSRTADDDMVDKMRVKDESFSKEEKVEDTVKKDEKDEEDDDDDEEEEDVSLMRMKSLVDGMMTRLEDRLTKTESALGDKLHKLDVNRDGVVDKEELEAAVMQLLRRQADGKSSEEAAELIKLLDQDNDGRITVKELMEYVASRDAWTEEESKMFESQKPKERSPDPKPTKEE